MAILDTNTINPEYEQTALWPFFNESAPGLSSAEAAIQRAAQTITPTVLKLIDKCEVLEGKNCDDPEAAADTRIELYDARSAVRRCAEQAAQILQEDLSKGFHKIGNSTYFVTYDPYARTKSDNLLTLLDNDANVMFMEHRGFYGDDELTPAGFSHHVRIIEDIIVSTNPTP